MERKKRGPARTFPLDTMLVGGFFFAPHRKRTTMASYVSRQGKALGRKFTTKTQKMRLRMGEWVDCDQDDRRGIPGVAVYRYA